MPEQIEKMGIWERFEHNLTAAIPLGFYQRFTPRPALSLVYHTITPDPLDHLRHIYPAKTPEMFEADLAYLQDHYQVISYPEYLAQQRGDAPKTPNAMLITFDDGYRECSTIIRPLLAKYDLPAIFFVTTDFLDNRVLFYRNKYSLCVARLQDLPEDRLAIYLSTIADRFDQVLGGHSDFLRWLRSLNYAHEAILDEVCALLDVDIAGYLQSQRPYMTSEEVRGLAAAGHTIGAHSRRHPKLNILPQQAQTEEIVESCQAVQTLTGQPQVPFAFPFSGYGINRRYLAKLQARYPLIGAFFDSKGVRLDKDFVLNRIWADPPADQNAEMTNIPHLIRSAYQENARWRPRYLANTLAARIRGGG